MGISMTDEIALAMRLIVRDKQVPEKLKDKAIE